MSAVNPEGDGRVGVSQKLKPVFVILKEIHGYKKFGQTKFCMVIVIIN